MRYLALGVDRDDCGFDPPSLGMFYVDAPNWQKARDAAEKADGNFLCIEMLDAARLREMADELETLPPDITVREMRRGGRSRRRRGPSRRK